MGNGDTRFNPSNYSDVPLYNIQAVSATSGVPAITLRSWERRYGIPEPKRDEKGYRLYSERDIAVTRWLKERVQQGIGISRAVNMLRVLEAGALRPKPVNTFDFKLLMEQLVEAIQGLDAETINRVMADALSVAPVERVCLELIQPALYRVGELWESGELSVTSEHFGSNLLRAQLTQLLRINPAPILDQTVVVACAPGEQHEIGALTLALFLRRRGYDVIYLGASVEAESLAKDAIRFQPDAILLSVSDKGMIGNLTSTIESINGAYNGVVCFGGRIFGEDPDRIRDVPATYLGGDAQEAVANLEQLISSGSPRRP